MSRTTMQLESYFHSAALRGADMAVEEPGAAPATPLSFGVPGILSQGSSHEQDSS